MVEVNAGPGLRMDRSPGRVRPGYRADITLVDTRLQPQHTFSAGRSVDRVEA